MAQVEQAVQLAQTEAKAEPQSSMPQTQQMQTLEHSEEDRVLERQLDLYQGVRNHLQSGLAHLIHQLQLEIHLTLTRQMGVAVSQAQVLVHKAQSTLVLQSTPLAVVGLDLEPQQELETMVEADSELHTLLDGRLVGQHLVALVIQQHRTSAVALVVEEIPLALVVLVAMENLAAAVAEAVVVVRLAELVAMVAMDIAW